TRAEHDRERGDLEPTDVRSRVAHESPPPSPSVPSVAITPEARSGGSSTPIVAIAACAGPLTYGSASAGKKPSTSIAAPSGPVTHFSRPERSVIVSRPSRTGPVKIFWYVHSTYRAASTTPTTATTAAGPERANVPICNRNTNTKDNKSCRLWASR